MSQLFKSNLKRFQKSELAGRIMVGPVILTMK